jgi:putative flippase GtrA
MDHQLSNVPASAARRPLRYLAVATLGAAVQAVVVVTATIAGCSPVAATVIGIEAAILHNFAWHDRWTWGDRLRREPRAVRLLRYNTAMAGSSLAVGAAVTWLVVSGLGWGVLPANAVAVAVAALANYVASDRVLFRATQASSRRS